VVVAAGLAAAEWTRFPSTIAAALAALLSVAALSWSVGRRHAPLDVAIAALLTAAGFQAVTTQRRLGLIDRDWPAQREARIQAYGERVGGELRGALRTAAALADEGAAVAGLERGAAFATLERAVPVEGIETGVAILEPDGTPWAWAGRHRLVPEAAGDSLGARVSGYYVVLETRRHSVGRIVVASALIWADPAIVDRSRSLAERFRRQTEVGLLVHPAGSAPGNNTDIFDYTEPTTAGPRLLFSVQPVPPEQEEARLRAQDRGARLVLWMVAAACAMILASAHPTRAAGLVPLAWIAARAPVRRALDAGPAFASDALAGGLPGAADVSPAALLFAGTLLTLGVAWLWRRASPGAAGRAAIAAGVILAGLAPLVVPMLASDLVAIRGHAMPVRIVVQLALTLAAAPLALSAANLPRPAAAPRRWPAAVSVLAAAAIGAWSVASATPDAGWPAWLTLLWIPPAVLAAVPAPRLVGLGAIAVSLGTLASAVLWRADLRGRAALAEADVAGLAAPSDPVAETWLRAFADELARARVPTSAADLHALWRESAAHDAGLPAHVALWSGDSLAADLPLDSLAVPLETAGALARTLDTLPEAVELRAVPTLLGVHRLLVRRVAPGTAVTVVTGPRSALIARHRLGRLLDPGTRASPPYELALGPLADAGSAQGDARWRLERGAFRSDPVIPLPGGARSIHATLDLAGAWRLGVRGVLLLVLDAAVLAAIWALAGLLSGSSQVHLQRARLARSYRLRVAVALALFFVLPTIAFATWSFSHFGQEAARGRDLLVIQTLRDATQSAGALLRTPGVPPEAALRGLSERVNADLALYRGGSLVAASTPVLRDLGVIPPLMDARAFRALALGDEVEVTSDGAIPTLAERVGYRVIEYGPAGGVGVLVTPQVAGVMEVGSERVELALVLLLTTIAGIIAAIAAAGVAARALSRPVADLRRAAVMLGQGRAPALPGDTPPIEFEPVFGAFTRMAADVRASQRALEEARRRTDTVLSTVATGVIAVDPDGRILIANQRAVALVGVPLGEGEDLRSVLPPDWLPLRMALDRILTEPHEPVEAMELAVGQRRMTLQVAPMGVEFAGVVLALSDVTDLSRAERVLAWGEMARQVAHEIKNPLTPMRLGIQHLQRIYRDRRGDFEATLGETSQRILGEIDRLDTIARAFSRFGAPQQESLPLEPVDLEMVAGEVVQLYRLAGEGAEVHLIVEGEASAIARRDEVKEVLVNLLENARGAGARRITVTIEGLTLRVEDDGRGIPAELLPRIFEPRFSTNTSGSGLGLAIVRRLVESWGGKVEVKSEVGRGTTVTVRAGP